MKYKMIASDVDGTLNNDNYIISEGNAKAIRKAMEAGLQVVLCSGRGPTSLAVYAEEIGLNQKGCYGIGFNGGIVYEADTHKVLYEGYMDNKLAVKIIKNIKGSNLNIRNLAVYIKSNHMVCEKDLNIVEGYNDKNVITVDTINNLEDITEDIMKIMLIDDRDKLEQIYNNLKHEAVGNFNMVFVGPTDLEFLPLPINKAVGISKLAKHLGISLDEIVAVGDNYNDIEMVQEVGLGIAVANAVQPLKDVAKYVTKRDNNNDVMVEVVDMILNINMEECL